MNKCQHGGIVNHCQFCLNAQDYKIVTDLNADLQTKVDRLKTENERLRKTLGIISKNGKKHGEGCAVLAKDALTEEKNDG